MIQTYYRLILVFLGFIMLASFQNCSDVQFQHFVDPRLLKAGFSTFRVGENKSVPPLKLFFIVDNSISMTQHQLNLAQNFSEMFDQQSQSLADFDTTVYLFTTSASSPADRINLMPTVVPSLWPADPGTVPGAVLSYRSQGGLLTSAPYLWEVIPTAVPSRLTSSIDYQAMHLGANASTTDLQTLASDFSNRIGVIKSEDVNSALDPLVSNESGLCTMARILRNSNTFISAGDRAAFVTLSDENESDPSGSNCIQSISAQNSYKNGKCVLSTNPVTGTRFSYTLTKDTICSIQYATKVQYQYTQVTPKTEIAYSACLGRDGVSCYGQTSKTATFNGSPVSLTPADCLSFAQARLSDLVPNSQPSCTDRTTSTTATVKKPIPPSDPHICPSDVNGGVCTFVAYSDYAQQSTLPGSCPTSACGGRPDCRTQTIVGGTQNKTFDLNTGGLQCSSPCPAGAICGTGTIDGYILSLGGNSNSCVASNKTTPTSTITKTITQVRADADPLTLCAAEEGNFVETGRSDDRVIDRVSGSQNLVAYIHDQAAQIFSGALPSVAVFRMAPGDTLTPGSSLGVEYDNLANIMGSSLKYSVTASSYGPALSDLSRFINRQIQKSFVVPMGPGQEIVSVVLSTDGTTWSLLNPADWTVNGTTLTIQDTVPLEAGALLRVDFM